MNLSHYEFVGSWLTHAGEYVSDESYQLVRSIQAWQPSTDDMKRNYYVIPSLSSDFLSLLPSCRALLTCSGSQLSHLAILAREQQIPIFLIQNKEYNDLDDTGTFTLKSN